MALGTRAGIPRYAGPKCMGPGVQYVRSTQVGTLVDTYIGTLPPSQASELDRPMITIATVIQR